MVAYIEMFVGRDMLAMAYTGTGKTAAYLVPLLGALMKTQRDGMPKNRFYPSVIILQPTRELVQQARGEGGNFDLYAESSDFLHLSNIHSYVYLFVTSSKF